jgi:hypothetical protein
VARLIVNQGLQIIGQRGSAFPAATSMPEQIINMALDNGTAASNSFLATHTALSNGGATINSIASNTFSTITTSAQTVQHFSLFATNVANFQIGRVSLHNRSGTNASTNTTAVTLSTATLVGGIDQQSLTKTTDFTLQVEVDITYTSA